MSKAESITLHAVASSERIQARDLDWEAPLREAMEHPEYADRVWRRLQYVFRLTDPRAFPVVESLAVEERELLSRFVGHARGLAGTSLLNSGERMVINDLGAENGVNVELDLSPQDVTTGFLVMLRQLMSPNEEASFSDVRKVLGKRLSAAGMNTELDVLKQWRKAHSRLGSKGLEELVQLQMQSDGLMPGDESDVVKDPASPRELLRAFQYGDLVHWGDGRADMRVLRADPVIYGMAEMGMRAAAVDHAHFYLGFSLLLQRALNVAT